MVKQCAVPKCERNIFPNGTPPAQRVKYSHRDFCAVHWRELPHAVRVTLWECKNSSPERREQLVGVAVSVIEEMRKREAKARNE